ncbi:DedA family protein [Actinomycetospora straminea]|uniref:Membrane protein DedA with SNARE-associated domain n=1 Tax=Actinomycetospora straminea TaxID=663607 RepID=A0ABP9EG58_9PSEU|nr:DedA family protein [Actinomycetospora straminea]MDD7933399.1 DedA family protein [Actinomycetospora straminea]
MERVGEDTERDGGETMTGAGADTSREQQDEDTGPVAATPRRFRWRTADYSPEEIAEAKKAWRDAMPWDHPMSRGDKVLVVATLGVLVAMLATMPLRPFLLASHPTALAAVTGSLSATGAGAAFARIGEGNLWLVIAAGTFGMTKFDWLFWLAGRRWGEKIVALWAPGDVAQRFVTWIRSAPRWATALAVVGASLPGVPGAAVFALAGLGRMRLVPFLVLDALGAALMTGLVAGLGYGIGQHAVDLVLTIDRYALWITIGLIVLVSVRSGMRSQREQKARRTQQAQQARQARPDTPA